MADEPGTPREREGADAGEQEVDSGAHERERAGDEHSASVQPAAKRLTRSVHDRFIGGVAAGIAEYFALDPQLVRLAFVLVAIFTGGTAVLAYLVAWAVIPPAPHAATPQRQASSAARFALIALVVVGAFLVVGAPLAGFATLVGFPFLPPTVLLGLVLIAVGVLLFREDTRAQAAVAGAPRTAPPTYAASAEWTPPPPVPATHDRSVLGRAVVGIALVVVGAAATGELLGFFDLRLTAYFALGLLVVGVGLLVGAWRGTSRGLIILGLALVPPLVVTSAFPVPLHGGVGQRVVQARSVAELDRAYRLGAGSLMLDLSEVEFRGRETVLEASVGVGQIEVVVPTGVTVAVHARLRAGEFNVFGERIDVASGRWRAEPIPPMRPAEGFAERLPPLPRRDFGPRTRPGRWRSQQEFSFRETGRPGAGRLRLRLEAGMGEITVRRATAR